MEKSSSTVPSPLKKSRLWGWFLALFVVLGAGWAALRIQQALVALDLTRVPNQAWLFLSLCLGVAGLTNAFVQIVRTLLPLRGSFHRHYLFTRWQGAAQEWNELLQKESKEERERAAAKDTPPQATPSATAAIQIVHLLKLEPSALTEVHDWVRVEAALREFEQRGKVRTSVPSAVSMVYDLPLEQLAGQLNLAIDSAIDDALRYPNLLLCAFGPSARDLLLPALQAEPPHADNELSPSDQKKLEEKAAARNSLARLSQSEVDAFQIETGGPWRRRLRLAVVAVSTLISLALTIPFLWTRDGWTWGRVVCIPFYAALEGLIGGYLAMVLRDVIAIIEAQRRRA